MMMVIDIFTLLQSPTGDPNGGSLHYSSGGGVETVNCKAGQTVEWDKDIIEIWATGSNKIIYEE